MGKEVIIPSSGESAEDISIASSIIASGIIIAGDLNILTPLNTLNNTFLALALSNGKSKKELSKYAQGKSIVHLHGKDFKKLILKYPNLNEQIKIKEFVLRLDNLINLHQRRINILSKLKKAHLKEMFVDNVNKVPNLRFKDFKKEWEQRKLGDMGEVLTGNTPSTKDASNWNNSYGKTWITPTDIKSFKTSFSERKLSDIGWKKSRNVPANSVLITSIASIGKNTINTVPAGFNQQINAIIPKDNDKYFILNYMERYKSKFIGIAGKTATSIINKSDFLKFPIKVPSLDEQIIIGTLFNQIDELIELHQRKLNKLEKLKSSYLQKLFL